MEPEAIGSWPRLRRVKSAGRPAILFRGSTITYDELADDVDRLASALLRLAVRPGDRVAFLGDNHPAFVESLFATALVGAVFVPLNTRLAVPEITAMLVDSAPRILFSTTPLERKAAESSLGLGILRITVRDPEADDQRELPPGTLDFEALRLEPGPLPATPPDVRLADRAMIVYTSGTTGRPKGAVLTHGNLTWNAINVLVDYDLTSDDRALMVSPLFHVASLGMGCLPVLLKGATLLLEERFEPDAALHTIEHLRATSISGVPTTFQLMLDAPGWASADLSSLRLMTCGGSPVPERVRDAYQARGLAFSGGYGMTESSPGITLLPPALARAHPGSAGLAHFFSRFRIRDDARGVLAEAGHAGEIETCGPNVFLEYWRMPEATRAVFTHDGWLRTGDIGIVDDLGFLHVVDRAKDVIISGGENIASAEVELALLAIEGVTGAAVIGVPDERWGEVPHAVLTLAADTALEPDALVTALSQRLARYKVPRTFEVVGELPRTASGKVQKQILRARPMANPTRSPDGSERSDQFGLPSSKNRF